MTRILIGLGLVVLLAAGPPSAVAQRSADAYFHEAAQQYVAGNRAAAQEAVEQGLSVAPDDPRLRALRRKLREQRRSDSQSSQQGQQSRERQSSGRRQEGATEGGSSPSEEGKRSRARPGARDTTGADTGRPARRQDAPARLDTTAAQRDTSGASSEERDGPRRALSRAQAGRLLRALEAQERRLLQARRVRAPDSAAVEKDW